VPQPRRIALTLSGLDGAIMRIPEIGRDDARSFTLDAAPDAATTVKVFITRRPTAAAVDEFLFTIEEPGGTDRATYRAAFNAPGDPQ